MSLWIESGQPVPPRNQREHNETDRKKKKGFASDWKTDKRKILFSGSL